MPTEQSPSPGQVAPQAEPPQSQPQANPSAASPGTSAQQSKPEASRPRDLPNSLLNKPARPATVTISGGELAVRADNSSLTQILHQLASDSGMTIDGLTQDQRVFGSYGPGNPRDVLSTLLDGANYNVLMVGSTGDGAPRQLILTPRSNAPVSGAQPNAAPVQQDEQDDEQNVDENNPQPEMIEPPTSPVPPMPQQNPNGTVKTPQQILQELERMRQQKQQQQSPER